MSTQTRLKSAPTAPPLRSVDIAAMRLQQQIARHPSQTVAEVVQHLGAVQAQDYAAALWAVGLRRPGTDEASVERALADRSLVRTWPMRGTLHLVPATDVRWMLELMTPRILAGSARRRQQLGLDTPTLERSRELCHLALEGGHQRSREAMYQVLESGGISTEGQRGIHILGYLAQTGLLCFGSREGNQPTFTLLHEWVPQVVRLDRDEALATLVQRYFTGHGPATLHDLMWWSGLTAADIRRGIGLCGPRLAAWTLEGTTYWTEAGAAVPDRRAPSVYLLPGFDEYLLGYKDRRAVLDPAYAHRVCPGGNGIFFPMLVVDGQVQGVWKRARRRHSTLLTIHSFSALTDFQKQAAEVAAAHYGHFLNHPLDLVFA